MTSTDLRTTIGTSLRTFVAAIAVAVAITSTAGSVGAEPKKDVSAPGTGQALLCQGFGGSATVTEDRTGHGLNSVTVSCSGGYMDGMSCTNNQSGTSCSHRQTVGDGGRGFGGGVVTGQVVALPESAEAASEGDEDPAASSGIEPLDEDGA